ncbi:hypothetical protein ACWCRD_02620 [Streptomyces sp. NPDC002092]
MTEPVNFLTVALGDGTERVRLDRLTDGRIMCQLCFGYFPIDELNPVEDGVEDICKPCARGELLRGTVAYLTHGRKYHTSNDCPQMLGGEYLHDWDGDEYHGYSGGFTAGSYRIGSNVQDAVMHGRLPCLHCVPAELREFPPLYGQTFGHEPITGISLNSLADTVCQRCTAWGVWYGRGVDEMTPVHIPWPCTSAIVLGLVERDGRAA